MKITGVVLCCSIVIVLPALTPFGIRADTQVFQLDKRLGILTQAFWFQGKPYLLVANPTDRHIELSIKVGGLGGQPFRPFKSCNLASSGIQFVSIAECARYKNVALHFFQGEKHRGCIAWCNDHPKSVLFGFVTTSAADGMNRNGHVGTVAQNGLVFSSGDLVQLQPWNSWKICQLTDSEAGDMQDTFKATWPGVVFIYPTMIVGEQARQPDGARGFCYRLPLVKQRTFGILWPLNRLVIIEPSLISERVLSKKDFDRHWRNLESADPELVQLSISAIAGQRGLSASLIEDEVKGLSSVSESHIRALIRNLDSQSYIVRERAFANLVEHRLLWRPVYVSPHDVGVEARRRLDLIVQESDAAAIQRILGGVDVLVRVGNEQSRKALMSMAAMQVPDQIGKHIGRSLELMPHELIRKASPLDMYQPGMKALGCRTRVLD